MTGKPGAYLLHHRKTDEVEDEECLDRVSCTLPEADLRLGNCKHCGAQQWNILGDQEKGYALSQGEKGEHCVQRDGAAATTRACESGYVALQLQFATRDDLRAMESHGARLITAASDGDEKRVKEYLKDGVDVNSRDWDNLTAVVAAASAGHKKLVQLLVREGADVNAMDKDNITALMEVRAAARNNDDGSRRASASVVLLFLVAPREPRRRRRLCGSPSRLTCDRALGENGSPHAPPPAPALRFVARTLADDTDEAGVRSPSRPPRTTLDRQASIMGHKDIAELLVKEGAVLDAPAASGVTALWLAAGEGKGDVLTFLIKKGGDVKNQRVDGITALMAACVGGHLEAAKGLVKHGADVEAVDQDGLTAIMNAAENGSAPIIEFLVESSADPNAMSETGFTPLIIAAAGGHLAAVELLVAKGAAVEAKHPEGVNALMYAAAGGHDACVGALVKAGADVNALHAHGGSALMEAATAGNVTTIELLIGFSADVMVRDNDGVTALMSAASQGHRAACELLIAKGIAVDDVAASGGTALMFAAAGGHSDVVRLLLGPPHAASVDVNRKVAATPEYIDQVAKAIADGNEEVEPHKDGVTALMVAAQGGHLEVGRHAHMHAVSNHRRI